MLNSDEHIMEAVANGQTQQLAKLYERYRKPVLGFVWNQTSGNRQLSEDVLQDTFERVLKYKATFKPERSSFKAWIFTIARNALHDRLKKQRPTQTLNGIHHPTLKASSVTQLLEFEDTQSAVQKAINQLKPAQRELLDLAWKRQLKYKAIATITQTTESNVKVSIHRAVKQLRNALKATEL